MMKIFLSCCFFLGALVIIQGQNSTPNNDIISISSGVSFGMCRGYCRRSIMISSNLKRVISIKEANYQQTEFPPVKKAAPFTAEEWNELVSLVDFNAFQALNEQIGCPDCADGGAEWIQIETKGQMKKVTFENGRLIKGFEGLVVQLRNLRNQYTKDL
ncbi:hypothetical protein I4U23_006071 [Adineta vaga]|nr:hypothetical protein I4U23_006071 [Adineta vaga]